MTRSGYLIKGFLNSYSQIFFSDRPLFSVLLILVTFIVPASGIAGAAGVIISLLLARWLGFDKWLISKGVFSYNTLLIILPLGLFFKANLALTILVILASFLGFFLTIFFRGRLIRSGLPFLSWPFVVGLWIIFLAIRRFSSIEIGDQSLFEWNRVYQVGGISLVRGFEWLDHIPLPGGFRTYLVSLGAVLFQYNLLAGIVVAIGLVISSRIGFLLSLLGFYSAFLFYKVIGLDINTLDYSYIGFNYILTAIAIGGFYLIPSVYSFIWTIILIPVVTLLVVSLEQLFAGTGISIYALPFNLVVPLFLFVLYQRQGRITGLQPVLVQHNSPEKNLYAWVNYHNRLGNRTHILFRLPFLGRWTVSQGPDGKLTHRSDWRHAWDFVKKGSDGRTYSGDGTRLTDYLCYGKPVYPAADGVVDSVIDGIPDNLPGDANTTRNWGNTIVIRHAEGLYSKYSHLKPGSLRVKPGDYVLTATELALTGSSGRSPEPHLHFQFQAEPNVDASTIDYPFGYYLLHGDNTHALRTYTRPDEKQTVSNLQPDSLMSRTLHFIPGQKLHLSFRTAPESPETTGEWEVHTDIYNFSFIRDRQQKATAWFVNDGQLFYFTYYEGPPGHPLFRFFSACFRMPLTFDRQLSVSDQLPLSVLPNNPLRWIQDWVAPFHIFLRSKFFLNFLDTDDALDPSVYRIGSGVTRQVFRKDIDRTAYDVSIHRDGRIHILAADGFSLEIKTLNP